MPPKKKKKKKKKDLGVLFYWTLAIVGIGGGLLLLWLQYPR
jgi:hypothetical protein